MFFYLPSCTSALSVCLFVCIVYVFKKRNQSLPNPTSSRVIKINESVSDCLAPGPRKRENLQYPSGGAGGEGFVSELVFVDLPSQRGIDFARLGIDSQPGKVYSSESIPWFLKRLQIFFKSDLL
jgi:hypothetical protein